MSLNDSLLEGDSDFWSRYTTTKTRRRRMLMSVNDKQLEKFIESLQRIEGELQLLAEEKKDLFAEYKDEFDPRVLREAVRAVKARMRLGDSVAQLDDIIAKLENKMSL